MRSWFIITLDKNSFGRHTLNKSTTFQDFEKIMGGYKSNEYYKNQETFFKKYLNRPRKLWDDFLSKNLSNKERVLSIGSGPCVNELLLIKKKHDLVCSDLDIPDCYNSYKKLFGNFDYKKLNILLNSSEEKFDSIISLGVAFTFSHSELEIFFENIFKSLKAKGKFLLDLGGSEDSFFSLIYDKYFLPLEIELAYLIYKIRGKNYGLLKRHWGYKYKNKEILEIAKKKGFEIVNFQSDDFYTELERSKIFNLIIKRVPFAKKIFYILGRSMPYVRIFKFEKIE